MAKNRITTPRCPKCNKYGSPALDNYCSNCADDRFNKDYRHISDNEYGEYPWNVSTFFPKDYEIVKDKPDIVC